ncbi:hypothetical protein VNO78_30512 [Psophocarpus tetragonolobus]|uniref:DNA-directed RNA polymerase III subunit RPC3 n=1 Tax=Psophocarpus tetragonolobus TaxID=3891 RepID=A0AAN9X774_PSOTE
MVTQFGIEFAVHLIGNHFGNVVSKLCETLLRRGPLTLDQLIHCTELSLEQVKHSLLVLIQHNCVQPFVSSPQHYDDDADKLRVRTQYLALFNNIIHRLRFPKFLETVSQMLDEECVELLNGLLRDGRLTLKQMAERANQGKENAVATKVVRELLCKLLTAQFVERCPATEPVVSTSFRDTTTRKRGAKSAKVFEAPEALEQRVLEAAVPADAIRFSFTADMGLNVGREKNSDDSQMNIVEEDFAEEELILWRANFEEFICHLRHKVLIENVRTQHDDETATVLRALLEATRTSEKKVKMENSVPVSLNKITAEVMKTATGRALTIDRIRASLSCCSQRMNVDESCSIDLKKIVEQARDEEVESTVLKRYGKDAYRMFRLLSKDCCFLDTDKIAAHTLVETKKASKFLHKLWNDKYLHKETQTIVVAGGRPSNIFLWKVNKPLLWECVLDEMFHAALNLSIRMASEQEKNEELLNVPKDKLKEAGPLQKEYKRLLNVWLLLGSSLMKLDDALLLFQDF